jgi:hypothetical protein
LVKVTFGKILKDVLLRLEELSWKLQRISNHLEEGVSLDGQVLHECGKERIRGGFSRHKAVLKNDPTGSSGGGQRFEAFASDWIEYDARSLTVSNFFNAIGQVFFIGHDNMIGSKREQFGLLFSGACGGDADGSLSLGNLNGGDSDAAAGGGYEGKVAFGQLSSVNQRAVSSDVPHPDGSPLLIGEVGRILSNGVHGDDGDFTVDAVGIGWESGNSAGGFAVPRQNSIRY